MKLGGVFLIFLILIQPWKSAGDEMILPPDAEFRAYMQDSKKIDNNKIEVFVPLNLQPTSSQAGVYQQVLQHQLNQMRSYGLPMQHFQQWNGKLDFLDNSDSGKKTERGDMSVQLQPLTTQAAFKFQDIGQLKINHQMFLHETEYRLCPDGTRWSISHVNNPQESKERLMYGIDW